MANIQRVRAARRSRRVNRVRARVSGTHTRPRLAVFRSVKFISGQLIDDGTGRTIVAAHERELTDKSGTKSDRARRTGELLGSRAREVKISSVVFDRRHYRYHGRIAAFADGARSAGIKF